MHHPVGIVFKNGADDDVIFETQMLEVVKINLSQSRSQKGHHFNEIHQNVQI